MAKLTPATTTKAPRNKDEIKELKGNPCPIGFSAFAANPQSEVLYRQDADGQMVPVLTLDAYAWDNTGSFGWSTNKPARLPFTQADGSVVMLDCIVDVKFYVKNSKNGIDGRGTDNAFSPEKRAAYDAAFPAE